MNFQIQIFSGLPFTFIVVLFCSSSNASIATSPYVIGKNLRVPRLDEYPSICKIQVTNYDEYGNSGLCTGVLVSPDTINTVGHCLIRNREPIKHTIKVFCGGIEMDRKVSLAGLPDPAGEQFWHGSQGRSLPKPLFDFATLTLPHPVTNIPSIKATGPTDYFDTSGNLLPGVKCKILGFGKTDINGSVLDPYGDEQNGILIEADLKDDLVIYSSREHLIRLLPTVVSNSNSKFETFATLATSASAGDSGGPLACKAPNKSEDEILGLIVAIGWSPPASVDHPSYNVIRPLWF